MKTARLTARDIVAMKRDGKRIAALTAYDYTSARMVDAAGVPLILIGDTLGMVVQGEDTTLPVTLDQVIYHARMVSRGSQRAMLIGDMPFMTYQISPEEALRNAARLMIEGKVGAVKIEGGADVAPTVERMVKACIPVCGHLRASRCDGSNCGREGAGVGGGVCRCVGAGSGGGCGGDDPAGFHTDDRYWLRSPLRWRNPGFPRPVRVVHRLSAAPYAPLSECRRPDIRCRPSVRG
jgi:hypothetical protein